MKYINFYKSPLGEIHMLSDGRYLLYLGFKKSGFNDEYEEKELDVFKKTRKWLDIYFKGIDPDFTPEYRLDGTSFRKEVWKYLERIPYGKTVTYKWIADKIAAKRGIKKMSAQAVGNAVGHNPISIIVPCHRVIGSDGSLIGYAAGLDIKREILKLEKKEYNNVRRL